MRDILFRGKRKDNGEWIEGSGVWIESDSVFIIGKTRYYPDTRDSATIDYYEENPHYTTGKIAVVPRTVCQFTGLLDCGKKQLFERDVVTAKFKSNGARYNFRIVHRDGAFMFDNGSVIVRFDQIRSAVLIGNTIDTPDWKRLRPKW